MAAAADAVAVKDAVPVTSRLRDIYGDSANLEEVEARFNSLRKRFQDTYGDSPQLIARAPGRVNLIGEHIDYEGYSVLPMAIKFDTIVAIRPSLASSSTTGGGDGKGVLRVANVDPEKYPLIEFAADPEQAVDTAKHHWANYFLCGYKGVYDHVKDLSALSPAGAFEFNRSGLDVLVDGAVPIGSGLSSSAALVCSSAIAVMAALGLSFSKEEVAELACRCERYIGTQSGGMDQAISVLARPGVAKLIDFNPVKAHDVPLPNRACFVIANSLAVSKKAETAATNYNRRVVECRLAAMVLAVKLGMDAAKATSTVTTLGDVEAVCVEESERLLAQQGKHQVDKDATALPAVETHLHEEPYTRAEIEGVLGASLDSVFTASPTSLAVIAAATEYKLNQRARHVFSEARRVFQFRDTCASLHAPPANGEKTQHSAEEEVLRRLGALMNDSHHSCSTLYECSSPELEELVAVCRAGGAYGARLTGAGWGGCAVSLIASENVDTFLSHLKASFFASRVASGVVKESDVDTCVFASTPSGGAGIYCTL